ncbi:MAG: hypothetical protein LBL64_07085 [Treponema sp.]|nr:hypothetical protein [Treponema sp.]
MLLLFVVLFPAFPHAQDLQILTETFPGEVRSGDSWHLRILLRYPYPPDVRIEHPPFPEALIQEELRTRVSLEGENMERWTVFEYRFTIAPGFEGQRITVPEISILLPEITLSTDSIYLDIQDSSSGALAYRPLLRWRGLPGRIAAGQRAGFFLELSGWDPSRPPPPLSLLSPVPPPGSVLETLGEKHAEDGSFSVGFMFIPLKSGVFTLKAFSIRHEGYILERPALRIPVQPAGD